MKLNKINNYNFKSKELLIFLFFILFFNSNFAQASVSQNSFNTFTCNRFFTELPGFRTSVKNYFREAARTRGGSFFLVSPSPTPKTKLKGFIIEEEMPKYERGFISSPFYFFNYYIPHKSYDVALSVTESFKVLLQHPKAPSYIQIKNFFKNLKNSISQKPGNQRFAPFQWLERNFLDKPTQAVTQEILYTKKKLSMLVKLPLFIAMSMVAYEKYDEYYWNQLDSMVANQIKESAKLHSSKYLELALTDYRYSIFKDTVYNPDRTINVDTIQSVATLHRIYIEYYEHLSDSAHELSLEDQILYFSSIPFFNGVNELSKMDLQNTSFHTVDSNSKGPIPDEKILKLYQLRHILLTQYRIIDEFLFSTAYEELNKSSQNKSVVYQSLTNDPIVQEVQNKVKANQITIQHGKNILFMYAEQLHYLMQFQLLGITTYVDDNKQTPLTIDLIRNGALIELETNSKLN